MRLIMAAALTLLFTTTSFAQGWAPFISKNDFFAVNLPGEPKVQEITYDMEVKTDKGTPAMWALEGADPAALQRQGIKREDLRSGDPIKVRCHQLRDASNGCLLGFVTPMHGDAARGHGVEKEWD
jgi:hypothetical protein